MPINKILKPFRGATKKFLRKRTLKKRKLTAREELDQKVKSIHEKLLEQPEWKNAKTVMLYVSIGSEVDTRRLLERLLREKRKRVVVPVVEGEKLSAVLLDKLDKLKKNELGVPEPVDTKRIPPEEIDLIAVPGVAFTKKGHRLGLGGGYFDRFLREVYEKKPETPTIGLAFECQIKRWLPKEPHDQKVKKVITEKRVIEV
ncbi:MAG: 5-formyltetrahydrofolate cyclo-ligase [Candidatus Diapherotrites archaeon]|nr:5-formyltetrahydrofolate cyclo-ligase [Candidatus Diapherotrites archaeon]